MIHPSWLESQPELLVLTEINDTDVTSSVVRFVNMVEERLNTGCAFTAMITLGGYDDDPRELWEIGEARDYVCEWVKEASLPFEVAEKFLHPSSVALLMACGAYGEEKQRVALKGAHS